VPIRHILEFTLVSVRLQAGSKRLYVTKLVSFAQRAARQGREQNESENICSALLCFVAAFGRGGGNVTWIIYPSYVCMYSMSSE
jgi:hypothetical protein